MRKIKAKMIDILDAFEFCTYERLYFLDTKTSEIVSVFDAGLVDDEETTELLRAIERDEEGRFIPIPVQDSRESYRDMVAFTETVEDKDLQEKLWIALDGKGCFRRFKNVLLNYLDERKKWFEFKEERLEQRVLDWLEENELEIEGMKKQG